MYKGPAPLQLKATEKQLRRTTGEDPEAFIYNPNDDYQKLGLWPANGSSQ
jgi:hypothetical protein